MECILDNKELPALNIVECSVQTETYIVILSYNKNPTRLLVDLGIGDKLFI